MGMDLIEYKLNSCIAIVAEGKDWATIYHIESAEKGKGHATKLLLALKEKYKDTRFGGSVALNDTMKYLYKKTGIKEYDS